MLYWDSTFILVIVGFVISIIASGMVNSAINTYHKGENRTGLT